MPLCLEEGYRLCGIRLVLEDFCPGDTVALRPCGDCGCQSRTLWCRGETLFGFLEPGQYVLTACRGNRRMALAASLSPGSNAEIFCRLDRNRFHWRRDGWHYFSNRR